MAEQQVFPTKGNLIAMKRSLALALLGYDLDEEGNLVVNEEEALTVRLIFFMYLYGYSTTAIAELLTKLERRTKRGNTRWSAGSVLQVLQNERHCGEVLAHKTWTPNYLNHKSVKAVLFDTSSAVSLFS